MAQVLAHVVYGGYSAERLARSNNELLRTLSAMSLKVQVLRARPPVRVGAACRGWR